LSFNLSIAFDRKFFEKIRHRTVLKDARTFSKMELGITVLGIKIKMHSIRALDAYAEIL